MLKALLRALCLFVVVGASQSRTVAADPRPTAERLDGQVTTLQGVALSGVEVRAQTGSATPVGVARTDTNGRFLFAQLAPAPDFTLVIETPGYRRFALSGFKADGKSKVVQLSRTIDATYLKALLSESEPSRFRTQAADLLTPSLGSTGEGLPEDVLLPFLPDLCSRLRPLVGQDTVRGKERMLPAEPYSVLRVLSYCSEPRDDSLIDAWRQGSGNFVSRPTRRCSSSTIDGAVRSYLDQHFQKERIKPGSRPPVETRVLLSPNKDRALVSVLVSYAHWGYRKTLVLVLMQNQWEVRLVIDRETWETD